MNKATATCCSVSCPGFNSSQAGMRTKHVYPYPHTQKEGTMMKKSSSVSSRGGGRP